MEEELNPEFFSSLPSELQETIINQRPELTRAFFQVNPQYEALMSQTMLTQFCNQSITEDEQTYIAEFQPNRGYIYHKYLNQDNNGHVTKIGTLIILIEESPIAARRNSTVIEITLDNIQGIRIQEISPNLQHQRFQFYQGSFNQDLLSLYNLWTNRLNCMRIDPNYAKNRALDILDRQQEIYDKYISTTNNITFGYKNLIISVYSTLIMNKYIFNILGRSKLNKLINIDANINDIKHDISYLFEAIRNRILAL
jgi:hypothetical protein